MAKLNLNHSEYERLSYTSLDNNEKFGYFNKIQVPLYKLDINSITGEVLTLSAGAAGTTGKVALTNRAAVLNADGSMVGHFVSTGDKDTSFSFTAGTALVTEVQFNKIYTSDVILAALNNGEYAVDYVNGVIYYKKFDSSTTATCSYKYWDNSVSFGGSIVIGTVNVASPTSIVGGTQTVTTAGVRVALGGSTVIKSVTIRANSSNTGIIYVGGVTVSSANGIALAANDSVEIDISNLATVYIDSSVNGEGVGFTYFA